MEFEDILKQVGEYGKFQKLLVLLFLLPTSSINILYDFMFMMSTPDHWCFVPQLQNLSHDLQNQLIRPLTEDQGIPSFDRCHKFDMDYDLVANTSSLPVNDSTLLNITECQNGWVYDKSVFSETATTKFNLVCDDAHYVSNLLSNSAIGLVFVTPIFAALADRIGRRKTFLMIITMYSISCISPIILRDFISFSISRFMSASLLTIYYQIPFILTMEFVGPEYRTQASCLSALAYAVGSSLLPWIAYLTGNWIRLSIVQLTITIPFFIGWRFIPESASWLITQKRYEEAYDVLKSVATVNGKEMPKDLMSQIKRVGEKQEEVKSNKNEDKTLDLIRIPKLRTQFFILTMIFISNVLAYAGLVLNTLNFHGSEFFNYFILALVDMPALLIGWYLIGGRLGRRWTNTLSLFICGISLCMPAMIDPSQKILISCFGFMGKFGVAASYMIIYQQSAELFPTTLRSEGMGFCTTIGGAMGIAVPYITYLGKYGIWIPMLIMGLTCLVTSFLSSFLPETLNENLPQNISDSLKFGKNKSYFSLATIK